MTDKDRVKEIARAFLVEARSDSEAVRVLIGNKQYSLAIYHAQQSVEKLLKACLAAEGKIGIYKHEIFYFFKEALEGKFEDGEMRILVDSVPELEEEWSATRYPGWENNRIWIPSESYTLDDAREMESRMNIASKVLKKYLEERHKLK
jgi:HEPN domain-containing protein